MKSFDCIFINGDSYSAPIYNQMVYGNFLQKKLQIPLFNHALIGSNNHRILRSSIEHIHNLKQNYQNPLIIIGWSFIRRLEIWYYGNNQKLINRVPDSPDSRFFTLNQVIGAGEATLEQKALINEDLFIHKQLMDFYTDLYMFAHLLESSNLSYLFFSAAKNTDCPIHCFPYLESLQQVKWVSGNQKIYKLHDFCIKDWAKENDPAADAVTGHLSINGHEKFSNFLLEKIPG
jgi:hypothetical protein